MELPSLVTLYKKLQVAKAAAYTYSQDPLVRVIATQETRKEATQTRSTFKPYQVVVAAMQENPGATLKQVRERAKSRVEEVDTDARLYHSTSLSRQNLPLRDDSRAPQLWSATIFTLTEQVLRFALNSLTDTLPHNANLHLWKRITTPVCILCVERQTLLHVLNACPYALNRKRYNDRHDAILTRIRQLSPSQSITADLPNQPYSFPQHVVCTDSRPDIVVWDRSGITIIELTVPFELCVDSAEARMTKRYTELLGNCRDADYKANLLTLEVGLRGFINIDSFDKLYQSFSATRAKQTALEKEVVHMCLLESFRVWCKHNWEKPATGHVGTD